jgi:glycosyltransferase involved in cell wall biosynthesis
VDWWFAYNSLSARYIAGIGYPKGRITDVGNAIDTRTLRSLVTSIGAHELGAFKEKLGIRDAVVGIYCGGLYPDKRIDMLLTAAAQVRQRVPKFCLIIAGAGPDTLAVQRFVTSNPWTHFLGPLFGRDKALALRASNIYVNAGLVGLGILDAFASGLPVIVSNYPFHSPEIAYLEHGVNGLISNDTTEDFAASIVNCVSSDSMRRHFAAKALEAAETHTIERMVENFYAGILSCLSTDPLRR